MQSLTHKVRTATESFDDFVKLIEDRLADFVTLRASKNVVAMLPMLEASIELHVKFRNILLAIKEHQNAEGHDRCFENDDKLYKTVGLPSVERKMPPIEEHRERCDAYRAGLFGTPVEQEPVSQLCRTKKYIEVLEREILRIYGIWYGSEHVARQVLDRTLANALPATLNETAIPVACENETCQTAT